jgi:ribosomal protein S27AE
MKLSKKKIRTIESKCPHCGAIVICKIIDGKIVEAKVKNE